MSTSLARKWAILAILVALTAPLLVCNGTEAEVDESDVVVLTDANFDDELSKSKFALVEFYAPWCGHCKHLKPEYAAAAMELKKVDGLDVILTKLDATVEKATAEKFEIRGYPTLKWFVDGKIAGDFGGDRTKDAIVAWVLKKTGPATSDLADVTALEKAEEQKGVLAVAYFSDLSGTDFDEYVALAQTDDDTVYYTTTSSEVAAKLGLDAPGGVAVVRHYVDSGVERVSGTSLSSFTETRGSFADKVKALVKEQRLPAFLEFTQANAKHIFGAGIPHQVIIAAPEQGFVAGGALEAVLLEAGGKSRGRVVLVATKLGSASAEPVVKYFGLDEGSETPQVVGFDSTGGKKFSFPEEIEFSAESLVQFAQSLVDGTAKGMFKSATVPADPKDNGVTVVVGSTVDDIVLSSDKDVLLEVYAPWCGHCKALAPVYEKLAKKFESVDSIVIAKMDGTENEHPKISAEGFPTLLFFPANEDATAIPYEGDRTLKGFTKFLKKHAVKKFELPKKGGKKTKKAAAAKQDAEETHEEL